MDQSILDASDEIMVFVNGLFFGARSCDGYQKNPLRGAITITQDEILSAMNSDEEYMYLKTNELENQKYLEKYDKPYSQYNATLTFEWR